MEDGLEQGCRMSCYLLPLCMELLIQEYFFRIRSRQLRCLLWAYADDLALTAATLKIGCRNSLHEVDPPPLVYAATPNGNGAESLMMVENSLVERRRRFGRRTVRSI